MVDLAVLICAYNPRPNYLARVTEALRAQTLPLHQWDLILIDNASDRPLAEQFDISWHPHARHVREPELGLAFARRRGIQEAAGSLLVFVDDDNILAPDYLEQALKIAREWPKLGAWGGSISLECEILPPAHLKRFLPMLALREVDSPRWGNVPHCYDTVPWGAGMCVRAEVGAAYCEYLRRTAVHVTGRRGKSLTGGEDVEICHVAAGLGYGTGLFPTLSLTHLIPKERLTLRYFIRCTEAGSLSEMLIDYQWRGIMPPSPFTLKGFLKICKRIGAETVLETLVRFVLIPAALSARKKIREAHGPAVTATRSPSRQPDL